MIIAVNLASLVWSGPPLGDLSSFTGAVIAPGTAVLCGPDDFEHFIIEQPQRQLRVFSFTRIPIKLLPILNSTIEIDFILDKRAVTYTRNHYNDLWAAYPSVRESMGFKNRSTFQIKKKRKDAIFMTSVVTPFADDLFPDAHDLMTKFPQHSMPIANQTHHRPNCQFCGSICYDGLPENFCCRDFRRAILPHLPPQPDPRLLQMILDGMVLDCNFARKLNACLRVGVCNASVHSGTDVSFAQLTGLPYALTSDFSIGNPVYFVTTPASLQSFNRFNIDINILRQAAGVLLESNPTLRDYITEETVVNGLTSPRLQGAVTIPNDQSDISVVRIGTNELIQESNQIYAHTIDGDRKWIDTRVSLFDQLCFPLAFSNGTSGFGKLAHESWKRCATLIRCSLMCTVLQPAHHWIHSVGYLREELICISFGRIMEMRVQFLLHNQMTIQYQHESDAVPVTANAQVSDLAPDNEDNIIDEPDLEAEIENFLSDDESEVRGERTFVPRSFTGSPAYLRNASERVHAICAKHGPPTVFGTITMNPYHPSLQAILQGKPYGSNAAAVSVVFRAEIKTLLKIIRQKKIFGSVTCQMTRLEYQQRGLPHIHILLWTDIDVEDMTSLDTMFCAELPRRSLELEDRQFYDDFRQIVKLYQTHKHSPRCHGKHVACVYNYPQSICPATVKERNRIFLRRSLEEDTEIVPYNPYITWLWRGHTNFEPVVSDNCVGYVLKYVTKASDLRKASIRIYEPSINSGGEADESSDDDAGDQGEDLSTNPRRPSKKSSIRYHGKQVGKDDLLRQYGGSLVTNAVQCVDSFSHTSVVRLQPAVTLLAFSLPDMVLTVTRRNTQTGEVTVTRSTNHLLYYFARPLDPVFNTLTFCQYFELYRFTPSARIRTFTDGLGRPVHLCKKNDAICGIKSASPTNSEKFWLRIQLKYIPARSYEDILTVGGIVQSSFHAAAQERGLTRSENEFALVMVEAIESYRTPASVRFLACMFVKDGVHMNVVITPFLEFLQSDCRDEDDYFQRMSYLAAQLRIYPFDLGIPYITVPDLSEESADTFSTDMLTAHQRAVSFSLLECIATNSEQLFFLQGRAGTGKSFTVNCLLSELRAMGLRYAITASTGIAAAQYEGGQTFHSLFRLGVEEDMLKKGAAYVSGIIEGTAHAEMLKSLDLIIVDECSMLTARVMERADFALRTLTHVEAPFGGRKILFIGDFLQLPPVVKHNESIENQILLSTPWWQDVHPFALFEQVRSTDIDWVTFLRIIGNGLDHPKFWSSVGCGLVTDSLDAAFDFFTFGVSKRDRFPIESMWIASTHSVADSLNSKVRAWRATEMSSLGRVYAHNTLSDAVDQLLREQDLLPANQCNPSYVNRALAYTIMNDFTSPEIPDPFMDFMHGSIYIVMRNINTSQGLVKGARCHVLSLSPSGRIVQIQLLNGLVFDLPRIRFPATTRGITFTRHQIPLRLAFAGTVHRSQGLTLNRVVVDLRSNMWEHGQLYVALSRVRNPQNMCILLPCPPSECAINTVTNKSISVYVQSLEAFMTPDAVALPIHRHPTAEEIPDLLQPPVTLLTYRIPYPVLDDSEIPVELLANPVPYPGIPNLRATCYMGSVIQFLRSVNFRQICSDSLIKDSPLFVGLQYLDDGKDLSSDTVWRIFLQFFDRNLYATQMEASLFLTMALDKVSSVRFTNAIGISTRTHIQCLECGRKTNRVSQVGSAYPVTTTSIHCLLRCIAAEQSVFVVDRDCPRCQALTKHEMRASIAQSGDILLFIFTGVERLELPVVLPIECSPGEDEPMITYEYHYLSSVHFTGVDDHGHYVCFVATEDGLVCYNDSHGYLIDNRSIISTNPAIAAYKRYTPGEE